MINEDEVKYELLQMASRGCPGKSAALCAGSRPNQRCCSFFSDDRLIRRVECGRQNGQLGAGPILLPFRYGTRKRMRRCAYWVFIFKTRDQ